LKKKTAFTFIETIFAGGISAMIITIGMSVIGLMTFSLYTGQLENTYRSDLNSCIFYLSREIQSAESVIISDSGKKIEIKQHGNGKEIEYSFKEDYPMGFLEYEGKKIIAVKYDDCLFSLSNNKVKIDIVIVGNNIEANQRPRILSYEFIPRSVNVFRTE